MNNSIFKLFLIIILTLSGIAEAQNLDLPTEYVRNTLEGNNAVPENVAGTPYLNDDFQKGQISINGKSFSAYLRYNGLKDEFEIKSPNGEITALLRRPNIDITLQGATYSILPYIDDNGIKKQIYFKHLNEGSVQLLEREGIKLVAAVKANTSYGRDKPAKFDPFKAYYLKKKGKPALKIRLKKKDLLKFFDDNRVKEYVKDKNPKNESEVIDVVNYYNTLN